MRAAFWSMAAVFALVVFAVAAPSPLYRVYQADWGFSATTLTAIFGVYALVLLVTLLVVGSISDYIGRRPVIVAGLAFHIVACALFLLAHDVGLLFVARALQGVAVGAATGAVGAALMELQPQGSGYGPLVTSSAPTAGLALGALGASALAQYAPAPTQLIWWLLLAAFAVCVLVVLAVPESGTRHPGALASLRPRVRVPREARTTFVVAAPALVAVWALGGLYLSLGPSLAAVLTGSSNRLWGGIVIFLLNGIGAVAAVLFRRANASTAMLVGCLVLFAGVAFTFAAIAATSAGLFFLGTGVTGVGFGTAFLGAFRSLSALAGPDDRAGLIAAIYIVSYLAFSVPAMIAGLATSRFGLHDTALVYSAAIAALVAAASAGLIARNRHASAGVVGKAADSRDLPPGPCTVPPSAVAQTRRMRPR
jgi:predicted MFS family arabinose efflux permease